MAFAENTKVPFERSIAAIIEIIDKAGADQVGQMQSKDGFAIQFTLDNRMVRFKVPFDKIEDMPTVDGRGSRLSADQRASKLAQSKRQRGRALYLVIKAKMESLESEIETFEQAFLAHVVMADGKTLYERIGTSIAHEYETGAPSNMLLEFKGGDD